MSNLYQSLCQSGALVSPTKRADHVCHRLKSHDDFRGVVAVESCPTMKAMVRSHSESKKPVAFGLLVVTSFGGSDSIDVFQDSDSDLDFDSVTDNCSLDVDSVVSKHPEDSFRDKSSLDDDSSGVVRALRACAQIHPPERFDISTVSTDDESSKGSMDVDHDYNKLISPGLDLMDSATLDVHFNVEVSLAEATTVEHEAFQEAWGAKGPSTVGSDSNQSNYNKYRAMQAVAVDDSSSKEGRVFVGQESGSSVVPCPTEKNGREAIENAKLRCRRDFNNVHLRINEFIARDKQNIEAIRKELRQSTVPVQSGCRASTHSAVRNCHLKTNRKYKCPTIDDVKKVETCHVTTTRWVSPYPTFRDD